MATNINTVFRYFLLRHNINLIDITKKVKFLILYSQ